MITNAAVNDDRFNHTNYDFTERKFDSDKCSSFDETNGAARTRVFNGNTTFRKLEQQNDLSSEIKCGKLPEHATGQREEEESKYGPGNILEVK